MILRDEATIRAAYELTEEVVRKLDFAIPRASEGECFEARFVRAQALLLRDLLRDLLGERRLAHDGEAHDRTPAVSGVVAVPPEAERTMDKGRHFAREEPAAPAGLGAGAESLAVQGSRLH